MAAKVETFEEQTLKHARVLQQGEPSYWEWERWCRWLDAMNYFGRLMAIKEARHEQPVPAD